MLLNDVDKGPKAEFLCDISEQPIITRLTKFILYINVPDWFWS